GMGWPSFYGPEPAHAMPPTSSGGLEATLQLLRRRPVLPGQRHVIVSEQAVVRQAPDRREIAMRDVARPLEATDVVGHRAEREVDADTVPRRQVGRRGVHQAAVEQDHRAGRTLGRDDAAPLYELADRLVVDRPEGIAGRGDVALGLQHAALRAK